MLPKPEEIFDHVLRAALAGVSSAEQVPPEFRIKGTTCVAIAHKDGVVVAADGRATMNGHVISTDVFEKLFQLDSHSVLAVAGSAGMAQTIARILEAQFSYEQDLFEGVYIPPKTRVNMIVQLLRQHMTSLISMGGVFPIFATYDQDESELQGRIFSIFTDGTLKPESEFECVGSGSVTARPVISSYLDALGYSGGRGMVSRLEETSAQHIAVYGLLKAHETDGGTGGHVNMMLIRRDGVHRVQQEDIRKLKERVREGRIL